jgi:hypothetical protein
MIVVYIFAVWFVVAIITAIVLHFTLFRRWSKRSFQ